MPCVSHCKQGHDGPCTHGANTLCVVSPLTQQGGQGDSASFDFAHGAVESGRAMPRREGNNGAALRRVLRLLRQLFYSRRNCRGLHFHRRAGIGRAGDHIDSRSVRQPDFFAEGDISDDLCCQPALGIDVRRKLELVTDRELTVYRPILRLDSHWELAERESPDADGVRSLRRTHGDDVGIRHHEICFKTLPTSAIAITASL